MWLNAHVLMQAQAGRVAVPFCSLHPCLCQNLLEDGRLAVVTLRSAPCTWQFLCLRTLAQEADALTQGRVPNPGPVTLVYFLLARPEA